MSDIHGGNLNKLAKKIGLKDVPPIKYDFSVNLNPLGPSKQLIDLMNNCNFDWQSYPDISCTKAISSLAEAHNIKPDSLTVGNGATELFALILTGFNIKNADYLSPCYSGYKEVCKKMRVNYNSIKSLDDVKSEVVFIGYPNNPTGHLINKDMLLNAITQNNKTLFVVDESFMDFVINSEKYTFINRKIPENLIIVKSLTKMFNIAGIRLGMACSTKENIERINQYKLPWSVNSIAQSATGILYSDNNYIKETKRVTKQLRDRLSAELSKVPGIIVFNSETNFIFFKSKNIYLQKELIRKGIFIRSCEDIECLEKGYYRIAVRKINENNELIKNIELLNGNFISNL